MSDQQSLHGQRKRTREEVGEDDGEKKLVIIIVTFIIMVVGAYRHRRRSSIKEITWSEDVNSDAKAYQNKAIENWDDICVLVGTDRATGEGAEQIDDSIAAMDMEGANEGESSSREQFPIFSSIVHAIWFS
ncbi:uncharacterized protein A4U43_C05F16300 [Asparagus officinalis]|uniref:Uncharacterized protein n=1 Tax=Asparagus officinalis TaxID=4686 RepID=A0A5P1ESN5_ASPOF|nr:uncharacterized protein A4U43_C05F16300 [Asparagus officinalis]